MFLSSKMLRNIMMMTTDYNHNSYHSSSSTLPTTKTSAAICAIQKQGLKYVDEWVDYHMGIGFTTIYLYDNSEDFELKDSLVLPTY